MLTYACVTVYMSREAMYMDHRLNAILPWLKLRKGIQSKSLQKLFPKHLLDLVRCQSIRNQSDSFRLNPNESKVQIIRIEPE